MSPSRGSSVQRVVIVGAGSAGCVMAARMSEHPDRDVLLIESGDWLPESSEAGRGSLANAFDPRYSQSWDVESGANPLVLRSGSAVGGSSAVNGCYFVRATRNDLRAWSRIAGDAFEPENFAKYFALTEHDQNFGAEPGHGDAGPIPVERDAEWLHPASEAFLGAALDAGAEYQRDLNSIGFLTSAQTEPHKWATGIGPVPFNSLAGQRSDVAACYLAPALASGRGNLTVMADTRVVRVLVAKQKAIGVEVIRGGELETIHADLVVLCGGTVDSPTVLLRSGIGPAESLKAQGVAPVVDLPGVGANLFNHPTVDLAYVPTGIVTARGGSSSQGASAVESFMQLALYPGVEVVPAVTELMATRRSYGSVTGQNRADSSLSIRVTLMGASGRGSLSVDLTGSTGVTEPGGSGVAIHQVPLDRSADLVAMRSAVRFADQLLRFSHFAPIVASRSSVPAGPDSSDADLDRWLRSNVGFSFHQMGTCAMGTGPDAVVDPGFRVHGVDGLAVVDASVVPVALSRGPSATVVALAELAADLLSQQ